MNQPIAPLLGGPCAHLGRQAVFDRGKHVWAYELKYQSGGNRHLDGDLATSDVILNAFAEIGVERVVGHKHAFIDATRSTITGDLPLPVTPSQVTLQFDARLVAPNFEFVKAARRRKAEGFHLALDNFSYSDEFLPLLQLADYVKVEVQDIGEQAVAQLLPLVKSAGGAVVAKGVSDEQSLTLYRRLGCSHFQGDFLFKPQSLHRRRAARNFAILAELMSKLRQPSVEFGDIEEIIKRDAGLSVMLLRFLNSAGFGLRVEVTSIRQAVALLGLDEFGRWVTLLALASDNDKPSELLVTALLRAKTCEQIARHLRAEDGGNAAFLVGLFSLLDAMLDQPLEEILAELPVPASMKSALMDHSGTEGEILALVLDHESDLWHEQSLLSPESLEDCWLYSVEWVEGVRGIISPSFVR